jgi:hypothetical protein
LNECAIRLVGSQSSLPEFAKFTVADILTGLLVFRPLTTIPVTGFLTFREEFTYLHHLLPKLRFYCSGDVEEDVLD